MGKVLDKVLSKGKPLHLNNTAHWGVAAYFIEEQFQDKEIGLEEIYDQFYVWIKFGFSPDEFRALERFQMKNGNLDTSDILWKIWSYLDAVLSFIIEKEMLDRIAQKERTVDSNRKGIL